MPYQLQSKLVLLCTAIGISIGSVHAAGGNPFRNATSTQDGYSTWDADAINIENVTQTGAGVYVAVLDTGLAPNYRDYFPAERIATELGKGFYQNVSFKAGNDQCGFGVNVGPLKETNFIGSRGSEHGTHVTSTIIGFSYQSNADLVNGFDIPPIQVRGIAPNVTIIPVKVLADYQIPALPKCPSGATPAENVVFGTSEMVAAGIDYVTDLAIAGHRPMVINMSLGGSALEPVEQAALDRAIANGVIIVASAGNSGAAGMGYPGAYPPVISVAAAGWNNEFQTPNGLSYPYRMYWLQNGTDFVPPLLPGGGNVPEPTPVTGAAFFDGGIYIVGFSSRELPGQELDVTAPGVLIRGPLAGDPGYSHLPWWSNGKGDLNGNNPGNFYYVSGTSMSAPHVAAVAALMLEKNPTLSQAQVESILKLTTLPIGPGYGGNNRVGFQSWGSNATGTGLVQADAAVAATP